MEEHMTTGSARPIKAVKVDKAQRKSTTKTAVPPPRHGRFRTTVSTLNPVTIVQTLLPVRNTPVQQLAFYGAVGALAVAEIIEPPIAVLIVGGHLLHRSRNPIAESLGEALDEAS
jgi:hypothetical protein